MTAGTVVITGGILATVILLCIIAVLCYCRLQVLPRDGDGDRVGAGRVALQREHLTGVQGRVQEGKPDFRGDALQGGWSRHVLFSGQPSNSLTALAEAPRVPRTSPGMHSPP